MQHMLHTLRIYLKIQKKFSCQQTRLIAQHYINQDLHQNPINIFFYAEEQILQLQFFDHAVEYYIRKNELFRDDREHNAVALVKNVRGLQTQFYALTNDKYQVIVSVFFTNNQILEIPCVLP